MNHLAACLKFAIANFEQTRVYPNMMSVQNENIIPLMRPFNDQSKIDLYISFWYWALNCSSMGAYSSIWAVTTVEQLFQMFVILTFRLFVIFLFSEL